MFFLSKMIYNFLFLLKKPIKTNPKKIDIRIIIGKAYGESSNGKCFRFIP